MSAIPPNEIRRRSPASGEMSTVAVPVDPTVTVTSRPSASATVSSPTVE